MFASLCFSGLLVIVAYLLGSIPTGYLVGRWLQGIDIREHGSGSIGATNVLRTLGKGPAIAVLLIDLVKGVSSLALIYGLDTATSGALLPLGWKPWLIVATALAAIIGHSRSIWLNFMGGKSAAIGLGVLIVMSPIVGLGTLGAFLFTLAAFRIVSLSSISAAIAANIIMITLNQPFPYLVFTALAGVYIIVRHRNNIQRLMAGTEPKIGQKLPPEEVPSS
ncbi:MAG: glycerol-3-phosphate 1-O-acyltransferase PlsY [Cyanobacteriota bacterium]